MEPQPQTIYFDESGFSGNNMLDDQPYFVYAGAAVAPQHAQETVEALTARYGLQGGELKGNRLLKSSRGREAILDLLQEHHKQIRALVVHKKYSLACKFFEYIFEPVLAEKSSLFYGVGFHQFISTVMYVHLAAGAPHAYEQLRQFQELVRRKTANPSHVFGLLDLGGMSPTLNLIRDFARIHRDTIEQELANSIAGGSGNWTLDVTNSALFSLLTEFGQEYERMMVLCDESKPLRADALLFDVMINRRDKRFVRIAGREVPVTFNLTGSIVLAGSDKHHGIQISDVAAAAIGYAFEDLQDEFSRQIEPLVRESLSGNSILPDPDHMDLTSADVLRNVLLLDWIVDRSRSGLPVLEDIEAYAIHAYRAAAARICEAEP